MGRKKKEKEIIIQYDPNQKEKPNIGKRILAALEIIFLVIMLGMCVLVFMAGNGKVPYIFGYRVLQVISDSMTPTINDETCIIIKKVEMEDIKVGDIITFVSEAADIKGYLNTHRVHEITKDETTGETLFITKGDAYAAPDLLPVQYEQVAGRYVGELPFGEVLFKGIRFLADRNNYFIIVMLPLFFCFMSYAKQFWDTLTGRKKAKEDRSVADLLEELEDEELYEKTEQLKQFKKDLKQAEKEGDTARAAELTQQIADLQEAIRILQKGGTQKSAAGTGTGSTGTLNKDTSKFYD